MELQQGQQYLNNRNTKSKVIQNNSKMASENCNLTSNNDNINLHSKKESISILQKISEFTGFSGLAGLEGFEQVSNNDNTLIAKKNKDDLAELTKLENKLNRLLNDYSTAHKGLMETTKNYLDSSGNSSGKNIKLSNNQKFYITSTGYYKSYPSDAIYNMTAGKNGCPSDITSVNANSINGLDKNYTEGTSMQQIGTSGQSCSNAGSNIFIANPVKAIKNDDDLKNIEYVGCFKKDSLKNNMSIMSLPGNDDTIAFKNASLIAEQYGQTYFSVWKNSDGRYQMGMADKSIGGDDNQSYESVLERLASKFSRSNKVVVSWSSDKSGAADAVLTPWGTIELRDVNKKAIWSTNGKPGVSAIADCKVDYNKLGENAGSLVRESITATMGGNCNGKLQPGSSSKYNVKTGNFNENIKAWISSTKDDKFKIDWNAEDPSKCCGDKRYSDLYKTNSSNGVCSQKWVSDNCDNYTSKRPTCTWQKREYDALNVAYKSAKEFQWFVGKSAVNAAKREVDNAKKKLDNCNRSISAWDNRVKDCNFCKTCNQRCGVAGIDKLPRPQISDPAPGCDKEFTSTYKCGTKLKSSVVNKPSHNRLAEFDCGDELLNCLIQFSLSEDGNFTIQQTFGNTQEKNTEKSVIWQTNTKGKIEFANNDWKSAKGFKGKSLFIIGQDGELILKPGNFIGSSNGKSRLYLTPNGKLELQYYTPTCTQNDGSTDGMKAEQRATGEPNVSFVMYRIKGVNAKNLGKVGYVDEQLRLHEYPDNLIEYGKKYTKIPNFTSKMNSNNTLQTIPNVSDVKTCETQCNNDSNCGGFNYINNTCTLGNKNMYPNVNDVDFSGTDGSVYVRERMVKNHHSCNTGVISVTSDKWNQYPNSSQMTMDRLCNLGIISKKDYGLMEKKNKEIAKVSVEINKKINELSQTRSDLNNQIKTRQEKVNKNLQQYKKIYDEIKKKEKENANPSLYGMWENSVIGGVMERNKNIGWTMVSLIAFLIFVKMAKKRMQK